VLIRIVPLITSPSFTCAGLLIKNMDYSQCVKGIKGDVFKKLSPSLTSNDPTKALKLPEDFT